MLLTAWYWRPNVRLLASSRHRAGRVAHGGPQMDQGRRDRLRKAAQAGCLPRRQLDLAALWRTSSAGTRHGRRGGVADDRIAAPLHGRGRGKRDAHETGPGRRAHRHLGMGPHHRRRHLFLERGSGLRVAGRKQRKLLPARASRRYSDDDENLRGIHPSRITARIRLPPDPARRRGALDLLAGHAAARVRRARHQVRRHQHGEHGAQAHRTVAGGGAGALSRGVRAGARADGAVRRRLALHGCEWRAGGVAGLSGGGTRRRWPVDALR